MSEKSKMDMEKSTKTKMSIKIKKKCFDKNFTKNEIWGPKLQLSEPPRAPKHEKIVCQQSHCPETQKHIDLFYFFPDPGEPFDLANR